MRGFTRAEWVQAIAGGTLIAVIAWASLVIILVAAQP